MLLEELRRFDRWLLPIVSPVLAVDSQRVAEDGTDGTDAARTRVGAMDPQATGEPCAALHAQA